MEKLILLFVLLFTAVFVWNKTMSFFSKKSAKPKIVSTKPIADETREKAITELMAKIQNAKLNRPEIIKENPQLAAQILKAWVKKDEKK